MELYVIPEPTQYSIPSFFYYNNRCMTFPWYLHPFFIWNTAIYNMLCVCRIESATYKLKDTHVPPQQRMSLWEPWHANAAVKVLLSRQINWIYTQHRKSHCLSGFTIGTAHDTRPPRPQTPWSWGRNPPPRKTPGRAIKRKPLAEPRRRVGVSLPGRMLQCFT